MEVHRSSNIGWKKNKEKETFIDLYILKNELFVLRLKVIIQMVKVKDKQFKIYIHLVILKYFCQIYLLFHALIWWINSSILLFLIEIIK